MGNPFRKPVRVTSEIRHVRRKTIYRAQDKFVSKLVETTHENRGFEMDDGDADSVGPDMEPGKNQSKIPNGDRKRKLRPVVSSPFDEIDAKVVNVDLKKYIFPFENLVFEGGGSKGVAYCGAVRVLEELGIMPNIKRFAGSSAGAMAAALVGVGYDSYAIEEFFSEDLSQIFIDHSCGLFSLLPNLVRGYGWNPGQRVYNWLGALLEDITGNADITFKEVYENLGREICIVITNLNMMNAEYFHPKTTPDVSIRMAVRMSISIPGLFKATKFEQNGQENTYVDGGLLCNYPINCFDGWWLSLKMEDSFLNKLQPLEDFPKLFENKERFGTYNNKTLGFSLYADNERDILRNILEKRVGVNLPEYPKTKLAAEKTRKKKMQEKVKSEHVRILHAVSAFLKVLKKHNTDNDDKINKEELTNALNDKEAFPQRYVERLFGKNVTVDEAMEALDEDQDGEVYYHELVHFIERTGVSLQSRFLHYHRKEIKGVVSFFETLQIALLTNVKRISVEERDIDRTVGINTGHVGTSDFKIESADREFVVAQGKRSTEAYLRYYVVQNKAQLKEGFEPDFPPSRQASAAEMDPMDDLYGIDFRTNSYSDSDVFTNDGGGTEMITNVNFNTKIVTNDNSNTENVTNDKGNTENVTNDKGNTEIVTNDKGKKVIATNVNRIQEMVTNDANRTDFTQEQNASTSEEILSSEYTYLRPLLSCYKHFFCLPQSCFSFQRNITFFLFYSHTTIDYIF